MSVTVIGPLLELIQSIFWRMQLFENKRSKIKKVKNFEKEEIEYDFAFCLKLY